MNTKQIKIQKDAKIQIHHQKHSNQPSNDDEVKNKSSYRIHNPREQKPSTDPLIAQPKLKKMSKIFVVSLEKRFVKSMIQLR